MTAQDHAGQGLFDASPARMLVLERRRKENAMALVSSGRTRTAQELMELIEGRNIEEDHDDMLSELRQSVKRYEERYGMASACIHDAIEAGELVEDQDVGHWIFQFDLLTDLVQRVEEQ
ncbi:MAG: hypothetical protein ACRDJC_02750 [Thermomicrobiales bacterium]